MHEYSLVQDLLAQVASWAGARGAVRVKHITVGMGELAGVDADLFAKAFDTFRAAGCCGEADLTLRRVDARWVCSRCERAIERGSVLRCPSCGAPGRLAAGDELILERIELEVPEPHGLRAGGPGSAGSAD